MSSGLFVLQNKQEVNQFQTPSCRWDFCWKDWKKIKRFQVVQTWLDTPDGATHLYSGGLHLGSLRLYVELQGLDQRSRGEQIRVGAAVGASPFQPKWVVKVSETKPGICWSQVYLVYSSGQYVTISSWMCFIFHYKKTSPHQRRTFWWTTGVLWMFRKQNQWIQLPSL